MDIYFNSDKELPTFGKIQLFIEFGNFIYFIAYIFLIKSFIQHIQAYGIKDTNEWLLISKNDFSNYITVNIN